jgi:1-acyl-sn-glycerol-3-phosphate acyltransferase
MGWRQRLLGGGDASIARARRPGELAASMATPPPEGLDWLRARPGPRAPLLYRVLLALGDAFLFHICAIRVTVQGREHLPAGGSIVVAALHRSWIDPVVLLRVLPREPRPWFLGSGPTAFDRAWKERLLRRTGGILPVWRGGADVEVHVRAAQAVVDEGAILALFMEGAIGGPPDRISRLRDGAALLAMRTGAPIVLMSMCGAETLHRGKRIAVRVMPATTVEDLLGTEPGAITPLAGTRDELRRARALTRAMAARIDTALALDHPGTLDAAAAPRRWTWLERLMR